MLLLKNNEDVYVTFIFCYFGSPSSKSYSPHTGESWQICLETSYTSYNKKNSSFQILRITYYFWFHLEVYHNYIESVVLNQTRLSRDMKSFLPFHVQCWKTIRHTFKIFSHMYWRKYWWKTLFFYAVKLTMETRRRQLNLLFYRHSGKLFRIGRSAK